MADKQTPEETAAEEQLHDAIQNYARVCHIVPGDSVTIDWLCSIAAIRYADDGQKITNYGFMGKETSSWHSLLGLSEYTSKRLRDGDDDG
jgi:hypothetical protein